MSKTEDFITKARAVHGDRYDYSKVEYKTRKELVTITCSIHGDFEQVALYHTGGRGCHQCGKSAKKKKPEDYIAEVTSVHNGRYGYDKTVYKSATGKITIKCPVHGYYEQQANNHLNGSGCRKCADEANASNYAKSQDQFIREASSAFEGKYNYNDVDYINSHTHISITCPVHGEFTKMPYAHIAGQGCPNCSTPKSSQESLVGSWFPESITNDRVVLDGREIDILIEKVGIEIDGVYWHSDKFRPRMYHLDKTKLAESKGYTLLHFWDLEVDEHPELVRSMINSRVGLSTRLYARKCEIKSVTFSEAESFLSKNHLQGSKAIGSIRYGLYNDNVLVCLMTFGKPRFNKEYDWELIRFCNIVNCTVIGGASRLFKHFLRNHTGDIISYANRRFSAGGLYEKLGFHWIRNTAPNYFYYDGAKLQSRNKFQKHKLPEMLKLYSPDKSESENMRDNGYYRIFDCGNMVFEYRR